MPKASNDRYAQVAQDGLYEAGWEMTPSEAREQLDFSASLHIDGSESQFGFTFPCTSRPTVVHHVHGHNEDQAAREGHVHPTSQVPHRQGGMDSGRRHRRGHLR